MKKQFLTSFLLYLTLATLTVSLTFYRVSAQTAVIAVDPTTSNVNAPTTFSVNVNVSNIVNFTAWQFRLYYLNSFLRCINATEGPFLKTGGGTYFGNTINNTYNSTSGYVLLYDTLLGNTWVNGGGVLTTITFQAIAGGDSPLHLDSIELGDTNIPPQPIPYTSIDGIVNSTGPAPIHDVGITNVTSPKSIIFQGYSGNITVTLIDEGNFAENTTVTVYANMTSTNNATIISTITNATINILSSINVTCTWNATGFAKGNYTISAYVQPVPGETNTNDNNFTDGWIMITMVGDLTGPIPFVPDGIVNIRDISVVAKAFGSTPGMPLWNANCDVNNDGIINIRDISIVAKNFGQIDP